MSVFTYTSGDQVRALLGVTAKELSDTTIQLEVFDSGLEEDLIEVASGIPEKFAIVAAIAEGSRTAKEARLFRTCRAFATISVAKRVGTSLPMFGPKDITDGKAGISRFSDAPYKATMKSIEAEFGMAKSRLQAAFADYNSSNTTLTVRTYFVASPLAVDPVTGE